MEALSVEMSSLQRQPSPLAAAQAAQQEVLTDQRKFQEVIAGNQVSTAVATSKYPTIEPVTSWPIERTCLLNYFLL
jgi:hypothetical protein